MEAIVERAAGLDVHQVSLLNQRQGCRPKRRLWIATALVHSTDGGRDDPGLGSLMRWLAGNTKSL